MYIDPNTAIAALALDGTKLAEGQIHVMSIPEEEVGNTNIECG